MKSSKWVGYALDVVLLVVFGSLALQHPVLGLVRQNGLVATISGLPSPRTTVDLSTTSGWVVEKVYGRENAQKGVELQRWFDYVLGSDLGPLAAAPGSESQYFYEANQWKNSLLLPAAVREVLPHGLQIYARNLLAGLLLYYIVGFLWAAWIYGIKQEQYFPGKKGMPTWESMRTQMGVSTWAMMGYCLMPTWGEWFIERKLTHSYHDLAKVGGLPAYFGLLAAYIFFVEWGIYWVHRYLHDNKFLYLLLHKPHHIYNNRGDLSPFAGLAFHPIDGMLQASPYLLGLFILPVHFWTHEAMLFFTGIWTANIHDTLTGDTEPVMGAAYHTLHHTLYKDNYGQFFTFFDWVHCTLTLPKHKRVGAEASVGVGAPSETPVEEGFDSAGKMTGKKLQ